MRPRPVGIEGETVAVQTVLEQREVVHSRLFYVSSLRLVGAPLAEGRGGVVKLGAR